MTLQQMEYIVALDKYRHFVLAAEACGVTQPTLSAMIQKLEEELDVKIFSRDRKNISPTAIGEKIIRQARIALNETQRIREVVADESSSMNGSLRIGILPTIAPYLVPDFIYHFRKNRWFRISDSGIWTLPSPRLPKRRPTFWRFRYMWKSLLPTSRKDAVKHGR